MRILPCRAAAVAFVTLLAPAAAHAQAAPEPVPPPQDCSCTAGDHAVPVRLELETTYSQASIPRSRYFSGYLDHSAVSLVLTGSYRTEHAEIEAMLPGVYDSFTRFEPATDGTVNGTQVALGNPVVGAFYAWQLPAGRLRIGGSVALPVASVEPAAAIPLAHVQDARNYDHRWLWVPGQISVLPSIRFANVEAQGFQYATELVLGASFRVRDTTALGNSTDGAANLTQDIGYRRGVARVGAHATLVPEGGIKASVMPYWGFDFDSAYFDVGVNINLNNPFGHAEDNGLWAFRFRGGARF